MRWRLARKLIAPLVLFGCLEVDPIVESNPSARRKTPALPDEGISEPDAPPPLTPPPDVGESCSRITTFVPTGATQTAARQQIACTAAQIDALADACELGIQDPNTHAPCVVARAEAANAMCVACIFGAKNDTQVKPVTLLPGAQPSARINQAACLDLAAGIPYCGVEFLNDENCRKHHCVGRPPFIECHQLTIEQCKKRVGENECEPYTTSQSCKDGFAAGAGTDMCLLSDQSAAEFHRLFVDYARLACATEPRSVKDAGGDAQ